VNVHLEKDEVHVWQAALDSAHAKALAPLLSPDERARAERFKFQSDRQRFISARGVLRLILGRYLNLDPASLRFAYNPNGKPALTPDCGGDVLEFNMSHAHGLMLCAVTCRRAIGVDLEWIRPDVVDAPMAAYCLSARELAAFDALPDNQRPAAFFTAWTCKEAYLKARGEGLGFGLQRVEVLLAPEKPNPDEPEPNTKSFLYPDFTNRPDQKSIDLNPGDSINPDTAKKILLFLQRVDYKDTLSLADAPNEAGRWMLQMLVPAPNYIAALVVEGRDWRLRCRQWLDELESSV
jgi:4'-phosphopantetheinyl transferase